MGELPAKDIQIVAQYDSGVPETVSLAFEPPAQYDVVTRADQLFITVKRALASQDKLKVTFRDNPSRISVSNEFGETSTIDTGLVWIHRSAELKDKLKDSVRQSIEELEKLEKSVDSQKPNKRLQPTPR